MDLLVTTMMRYISQLPMIFKRRLYLFALPVFLFFFGCSLPPESPTPQSQVTLSPISDLSSSARPLPTTLDIPSTSPAAPSVPAAAVSLAYTYHRADGNRYVSGNGAVDGLEPLDIQLAGEPAWLVAAPHEAAGLWAVVLSDGRTQAFRVTGDGYEAVDISPERIPPGMPPALMVSDGQARILLAPTATASELTHPIMLDPSSERMAYIENNGDLVVWEGGEIGRLAVDALPDSRLLVDERGRLLLLTGPTGRYDHGVLGDGLEASAVTIVETWPDLHVSGTISIPPPAVIEGIAPFWTDTNGDGSREIIVTLSDGTQGARLVVFNEAGEQVAAGAAIGRGYRWRNQLAVAPFGPLGELELADVLTPHLGGVVEFFTFGDQSLDLTAQVPGYTSHVIGSRNLDMALAGDFDGDDQVEVLIPDQARLELGAISRTSSGVQIDWQLPIGGTVTTNLAAIAFPDGSIGLGVGRDDAVLRLWTP